MDWNINAPTPRVIILQCTPNVWSPFKEKLSEILLVQIWFNAYQPSIQLSLSQSLNHLNYPRITLITLLRIILLVQLTPLIPLIEYGKAKVKNTFLAILKILSLLLNSHE